MILDSTTRKLQISLAGTVATNQCPVIVDYVDFTASATTPAAQASITNNVTQVDILSAPGSSTQRKVNSISINNADTAAVSVTIVLDDNGTDYQIINAMVLPVGETLTYTDTNGWAASSRTGGGAETLREDWVQEFTSNGTWVKPGNCRFFMVECVGGGGGGGAGQGNSSSANARGGGGGGGGGKRNRALFLAKDLPATVSVTVGAQTSSAAGSSNAAGANGAGGNISSFGTLLYGYAGGGGAGGGQTANTGGAGGGGGGGTSSGSNATSSTVANGGSAMNTSSINSDYPDSIGARSAFNSFLGGGGGSTAQSGGGGGAAGGSSFFSSAGGGSGGGLAASFFASNVGGAGGNCGASATATGGGGTAGPVNNPGSSGLSLPGYCGQGGGGGGSNGTTTGGRGGDGGFPGGGGGGGGAGTSTGGAGGIGGAGVVRVWGW